MYKYIIDIKHKNLEDAVKLNRIYQLLEPLSTEREFFDLSHPKDRTVFVMTVDGIREADHVPTILQTILDECLRPGDTIECNIVSNVMKMRNPWNNTQNNN